MTRRSRGGRLAAPIALALAALSILPPVATAHAELESTTPADGATILGTPAELSATFSEALSADSTLSIRSAAGERLAVGGRDRADDARLVIDPVPKLETGTYEMRWTSIGDDGHIKRGTWTFNVVSPPPTKALPTATASGSAPSTSGPPSPAPTASMNPPASPVDSPSPGPDDPTPVGLTDVLLPIVAVLAIVLIALGYVLSRRGSDRAR
jgi:methionine-rich copper-binding protein CopC